MFGLVELGDSVGCSAALLMSCSIFCFCTSYEISFLCPVSESRRASIDIFLKAAGYLDFAIQHVLPQFPPELRFADRLLTENFTN